MSNPETESKQTTLAPSVAGEGLGASTVRHYIVQERYRDIPKRLQWWDDPDQPAGTERTPEFAAGWLAKDCREYKGHTEAFEHRIIERTERVYYPASDVDRMLSLPNDAFTDPDKPSQTK